MHALRCGIEVMWWEGHGGGGPDVQIRTREGVIPLVCTSATAAM